MKKAGRYWRQKFGRAEHQNVFSDIYNVSRDLSPSFVLLSRPQWKSNKMKPHNKNKNNFLIHLCRARSIPDSGYLKMSCECKRKPLFLDEDLVIEFSKKKEAGKNPDVNNGLSHTESRDHIIHLSRTEKICIKICSVKI